MNKILTNIGYAETIETKPGVWVEEITVKKYYGDIMSNYRSLQNSSQVNDNVNISNKISIVSDPYSRENFHAIRYAEFMGTKWKVTNVEVQYPRLILTLGGVYNNE